MRRERIPQVAVIRASMAEEFEEKYNARILELADKKITNETVEVSGSVITAVIQYEIVVETMDSVADEFHAEGIHYLCRHCPHLDDPKDKRVKHCTCKYAELGTTHKDHEACELFYKQLKQGAITPLSDYER